MNLLREGYGEIMNSSIFLINNVIIIRDGGILTEKTDKIKEAIDWGLHIILAVLVGLFIVTFVAQLTVVNKTSMLPTLQNGNILIIEKISHKLNRIKPGDIVTINDVYVGGKKEIIIKRVIALGGDTVEIKEGKVFVNGKELYEPYINGNETLPGKPEYSNMKVPEGCIYVLGDNRLPNQSLDSRMLGPISMKKIRGKAIIRLFPLNKIGIL